MVVRLLTIRRFLRAKLMCWLCPPEIRFQSRVVVWHFFASMAPIIAVSYHPEFDTDMYDLSRCSVDDLLLFSDFVRPYDATQTQIWHE
jgi:hypothetical protein